MKNKLIIFLAVFISHVSIFAQDNSGPVYTPVTPPNPQVESDTFGAQATPVDMYVYVLAIVAVFAIAYFAKKYKTQKI